MGFYWKYFWSLVKHKWLVFRGCWEFAHLEPNNHWITRGLLHDLSKFRPNDFICYARYWRKPEHERTQADIDAYHQCHWHHVTHNKHHWQYWISETPSGTYVKTMEREAVIELLLDWRSASYYGDGLFEWEYLEKINSEIKLHPDTRRWIESSFTCSRLAFQRMERKLKEKKDFFESGLHIVYPVLNVYPLPNSEYPAMVKLPNGSLGKAFLKLLQDPALGPKTLELLEEPSRTFKSGGLVENFKT